MGIFSIAVLTIIIFSSIQFVQYLTIFVAFLSLMNRKDFLSSKVKFMICSVIALEDIGMMLVNEHSEGGIINNAICKIQALIVTGSEICLYGLIGCLAYMKIRNDIGDYKIMFIGMFAYLAMIIPFIFNQITPGLLFCELETISQQVFSFISYAILMICLVSALFSKNKIDNYLNIIYWIFGIAQITKVMTVAVPSNTTISIIALIVLQCRNMAILLVVQIESKQLFTSYCTLMQPKKVKSKNNQIEFASI